MIINMKWIVEKASALIAAAVALGFIAAAYFGRQYRLFYVAVAVLALLYSSRKFRKKDTPFERRERELRNNFRS